MAVYLLTANNKIEDTFHKQTSLILMAQCCGKQNTPEKICSVEGLMALIM